MAAGAPRGAAVCVLGMSRTGTSLTTRVLSLAGVYLGPEEELLQKDLHQLAGEGAEVMARAHDTNPEGFWEHYRIMRLNERILRKLGGNWREPPELPRGWERSGALDEEREEARDLLAQSFGGRELWGWKDPRNCLTLPFWQRLVPDMRYVLCLRNPLDVAESLRRRDGIDRDHATGLWVAYVAHALRNTAGRPRLLVPYESHFEQPERTARRLAAFVDRDDAFEARAARDRLCEAIDERLWRNRSSTGDLRRAESVAPQAASLHLLTELLARDSPEGMEQPRADDGGLPAAVNRYAGRLLASGE